MRDLFEEREIFNFIPRAPGPGRRGSAIRARPRAAATPTGNLYSNVYSRHLTSVCFSHSPLETDMARDTLTRNPHAVRVPTPPHRSRTRNVCARRRRTLPFASPARKRPGVRHRRPHVARPRCFPCARITAFRFEPLCSQAAQHLESGLRQHPCDLDAISIISSSHAHGQASRRPRGAPRVTLRPPSRRPSPRRAQAAAPARLTCAASRRRWRRCPAPSCP